MKPGGSGLMSKKESAISLVIVLLGGGIWGYAGGEPWVAIVARAIVTSAIYALLMAAYVWIRTKKNGL